MHVSPRLFSIFDDWDEGEPLALDCKGRSDPLAVVFSEGALKSLGVTVVQDDGPHSPEELRTLLARWGRPESLCFWDSVSN